MTKSSPWPKLLTPLGILLAVALLGAAGSVWWNGGGTTMVNDGGLGELIALSQAARSDANAAVQGDAQSFDALEANRASMTSLRSAVAANEAASADARSLAGDSALWQRIEQNLDTVLESRDRLAELDKARGSIAELAPKLLGAAANVASALPPADLTANQPYVMRFEVMVESLQLRARGLGPNVVVADTVRRLEDAEQYIGQFVRGLRGEDATLGVVAVKDGAAAADLKSLAELHEQTRQAVMAIRSEAETLTGVLASIRAFDVAAAELLTRYRDTDASIAAVVEGSLTTRLPLLLVFAALAIAALMMFVYYRARDFRQAAAQQAEQNERNQQAILRLLDELSSLADGDLTVQATVTEDITGAIADSINYAIDALRELVTTINDSSILVDAASKQTEGTARHLVRSAETQAKQAAAASESMARMAISIEEVSGNAERCSDVARHAVEISHKGGEAVRRTIAGMNTIRETIQDTSKRIKRLGESSQEIGNIVELIEEIAEQTNILALNASIEASRAGEASRGFAVVADEVQKLAERSAGATKKIEVLVSTIQSDTNEAVMSMERSTTDVVGGALLAENAGAALEEIEQVSHQIASLVQNISGSSKDQTSVAGAITKNMHVLREISTKTTESTTAASSAISKLSELASQLRRSVSGFTLPDQGGGTGVLSAARVAASLERTEQVPSLPAAAASAAPQSIERRRLSG
ncbi:MAG TPA: methyl-accepting chemotaxis protein [Gammaproteobacteria bacterium]|nr:methyl-accepting chemotaxis protein [Gammaproteobacteria bacterium]